MRELIWGSSFKRALKKTVRQRPDLAQKIERILARLADDPFDPVLRTHKLKGELAALTPADRLIGGSHFKTP